MRFYHPLDQVFDSASKVRVLRFLCRTGGQWNGRQLADRLSMNPVTVHRALRQLHQATLLDFRRMGNNFIYSLRDNHLLVGMARTCFRREAAAQQRLSQALQKNLGDLKGQVVTMALFGSIARGQERPTSDLDLLILVPLEQEKRRAEQVLGRASHEIWAEFGNSPFFYVNTLREARNKFRRGLPLWENILKDHQLLWGKPLKDVLYDAAA